MLLLVVCLGFSHKEGSNGIIQAATATPLHATPNMFVCCCCCTGSLGSVWDGGWALLLAFVVG